MSRRFIRVLLVEDEPDDVQLILRELQRGGFEVTYDQVQTGDALSTALQASPWDIVISDYSMPGFTAPDALAILKASGLDIPFLIISGTIGEETAVSALQAGADDFLVKGRLARLLPAITRVLDDRRTRAERKRAVEALARSEAQHRSLVERAVFGICEAAVDGHILMVNPALVAMLGYPSADALRAVLLPDLFAEEPGRATLMQHFRDRSRFVGVEALWRPKTAEPIRVRLSGAGSDVTDRGLQVFQLIVEDITEWHRLQEQLRQAQKMEAIGQLAGGVAHDFNNLLTAILGFGGLLADQIPAEAPGGADVREITAAAERAAGLTRQLLAFSRKQALIVTPLDLNGVVRKLHPMLLRLLGVNVKIHAMLERDLDAVMADTTQIEQVLINLAVNARDAMPNGGTLTIETRNAVREGEFRAINVGPNPAAFAMLRVTDTGVGMTSKIAARVFEPFFTTKERGKGTGLGLAAVDGIIRQLGGAIYLDSAPGRGTTFLIYLPKASRQVAAQAASKPARTAEPPGTGTILLVEDESGVRTFARAALTRQGYTVLDAQSAEGALALLADPARHVDLVLSDVVLPGLSGRDLAARVAREHPATRVLLMSGYTERTEATEASPADAPLLEKPFTAQSLLERIRETLGRPVAAAR